MWAVLSRFLSLASHTIRDTNWSRKTVRAYSSDVSVSVPRFALPTHSNRRDKTGPAYYHQNYAAALPDGRMRYLVVASLTTPIGFRF